MSEMSVRRLVMLFSCTIVFAVWLLVMKNISFMQRPEMITSTISFIMFVVPFIAMYIYKSRKGKDVPIGQDPRGLEKGRLQLRYAIIISMALVLVIYFLTLGMVWLMHWEAASRVTEM